MGFSIVKKINPIKFRFNLFIKKIVANQCHDVAYNNQTMGDPIMNF